MALHIHRAERAKALADGLASVLARPLTDPFAPEVVAVAGMGVQRWLAQRLAGVLGAPGGDGVCANVRFAPVAALAAEVLGAATGIAAERDPWAPERTVWTLLRVLDASIAEPWCAVPARHLGVGDPAGAHRVGRRFATGAGVAALFDGYAAQRPALISEWAAGSDTDGCGSDLSEDLRWQPELWRRLRAEIGAPGPAERLPAACARLRVEPGIVDLPQRISLFGPNRLSADQLAVLTALGEHRDVHLWLVHPSPAMWERLGAVRTPRAGGGRESRATAGSGTPAPGLGVLEANSRQESGEGETGSAAGVSAHIPARADDASALSVAHPLLAALGRDARELQLRLSSLGPVIDTHYPVLAESSSRTMLSALQDGIRGDVWPPRADPALDDGTVQVHSCHGTARQVEVLRDVLLGLFAADSTLEARDVVVLCPDVDTFGPLVRAAFGQADPRGHEMSTAAAHPGHGLRVRLADRSTGAANPVLAVLLSLFELADGRVTVTQVLDLAATEPVRLRCGFDDDDIERLREWAAETGARWGIGLRQRQAFGLGEFAQNTLNSAVDRILLGVAADESSQDWLDLALPLDDVDSGDVDLAGRFAEFTDRLAVCVRELRGPTPADPAGGPRPAREWRQVLGRALELLTDVSYANAWQGVQARQELSEALEHGGDTPLRLPDIAALLHSRFTARPARTNFRTGELTVCGLAPLRAVPHRVVVLLGLDDDVFPRAGGIDGDDVLARGPRVGERDTRGEDRQLLLDAIMAARERLVLVHTGADPVTGAHRPPAIPVAELLDVLAAHRGGELGPVLTRHPLQAFDGRNFDPARPFSFDAVALAGARAAALPAQSQPAFLPAPLPAAVRSDVELAELISFVEHPVRAFLWQRLGIRVPEEDEEIDERLPIELDGLAKWNMGERMLAARLHGAEPGALRAAEWRRGTLPPFGLGAAVLDDVEHTVDKLVQVARPIHELPSRSVDIAVDLGEGRLLSGTVADVHDDAVVRTTFSRLAAKHRAAAWVRVLALAATERHQGWRALTIGRGRFGRPAWRSVLAAPNGAAAQEILRDLVALRDEGLAEPLPIAPAASAVYAERRCQGATVSEARAAADQEFLGGPNGPKAYGEHTDRYLRYIWGAAPRLEQFETPLPEPDPSGESTRFGVLARRLWNPLLAVETQGQP